MANIAGMYDPNAEPEAPREYTFLPPGDYVVQIVESDIVPTKSGSGQMLKLTMDILEGEATGRKLWDNLNLVNPNAQTVEIAQRALNQITHAVGRIGASNSEDLHFIPLIAVVKVDPAKNGYPASNKISGYKAAGAGAARPSAHPQAQAQTTQRQAPPPTKPATAAPPWRRTA